MKTLWNVLGGITFLAVVTYCTCGHNDGLCEYDVINMTTNKTIDHFRRSCRPSFSKDGIYYKNLTAGK